MGRALLPHEEKCVDVLFNVKFALFLASGALLVFFLKQVHCAAPITSFNFIPVLLCVIYQATDKSFHCLIKHTLHKIKYHAQQRGHIFLTQWQS